MVTPKIGPYIGLRRVFGGQKTLLRPFFPAGVIQKFRSRKNQGKTRTIDKYRNRSRTISKNSPHNTAAFPASSGWLVCLVIGLLRLGLSVKMKDLTPIHHQFTNSSYGSFCHYPGSKTNRQDY